ncbi:hypothetical protein AAYQ05_01995 [Flavobacterium sp. B11]|uniref:hypothetical protein n=1 Tax=Flavobacterium movens TaxID=214860 RepID=UPI0031E3E186
MIRKYSVVLLLFVILSCKSKEDKMFFDFDSVEYYSLNKSKEKEIEENNRNGIKDSIINDILYSEFPEKLNNEVFYEIINSRGFSKFDLSQKDVDYLKNDIFVEKISLKVFGTMKACAPEYRDFLVFRKNDKVSGIAKICLWCGHSYFISSKNNINTEDFGTEEDYESLKELFNTYKN